MNAHDMTFEDFEVGDVVSFRRCFTVEDRLAFSAISSDTNPMHCDDQYAAGSAYGQATVPFMLAAAPLSAVAGRGFGRHRSLCLTTKLKAIEPVLYNQEISYSARVIGKHSGSKALTLRVIAFQDDRLLLEAEMLVQIRGDVPPAPVATDALEVERPSSKKTALVTWASGAIGRATARLLARRGWDLVLHYNTNRHAAESLQEELSGLGRDVEVVQASLDDHQQTAELVQSVAHGVKPTAFLHLASPPLDAPAAD